MSLPCLKRQDDPDATRTVFANGGKERNPFPDNTISNTKYTPLTFLPKNLFEQFSRFMNVYFLLIACLQLWSTITPVNPWTTWAPLVLIFLLSAIKEAVDDYFRFVSDRKANTRQFTVARGGTKTNVSSSEIICGDIIFLDIDDEIPADCVLLQSSQEGNAYIETANLDGETDYKPRQALPETQALTEAQLITFSGVVNCRAPNAEVYVFNSQLLMTPNSPDVLSLSARQTLLQGTHVRNTELCAGLVVYTGNESKLGKNKRKPPTKWTKLDKFINRVTQFIFLFQVVMFITFGALGDVWKDKNSPVAWYLDDVSGPWYTPIIIPLRFMLLMSYMIPISLKVTLDFVKFYYSRTINWDVEMFDSDTQEPAEAKNTSISEDMGQIEYVFTDKTGTLTENIMRFRKCSIERIVYGHSQESEDAVQDPALRLALANGDETVGNFFRCLALCQTVVPSPPAAGSSHVTYKASSPDEEALVKASQAIGIEFLTRDNTDLELNFLGIKEKYELMTVLEFSSDRKRMSVILRDKSSGKLILYSKGADDKILARLRRDQEIDTLQLHLESFAAMGLRTLVIAHREIDAQEFMVFNARVNEANTSIDGREQKLAELYETVERDLYVLGCTAIEDKLQEEVPETIAILRQAGIKFWMLTGDKYATAIQIATACNLMSPAPEGELLTVAGKDLEEITACVAKHAKHARELSLRGTSVTVIIEGVHLGSCLQYLRKPFLDLCLLTHSIICCRVTPQQKAEVVKLVKEQNYMCLSIGDGGNDVSMIQEAHVGVGIAGREGKQASRASDYSIGKFRFLRRLILVHGRYSYRRTALIAQYCFYKSLYICLIQVFYNFFTGFSGVSLFNSFSLTTYNVLFTGLPVFGFALDKDVPEKAVMGHPELYKLGQEGDQMNARTFIAWFIRAVFQSAISILFTVGVYSVDEHHRGDGTPIDYASLSMVTYTAVILVNQATVLLESMSVTFINHILIWGTVIVYYIIVAAYSGLSGTDFYSVMFRLYADPNFWFTTLSIAVTCIIPVYIVKYLSFNYLPTQADVLRYRQLTKNKDDSLSMQNLTSTNYSSTMTGSQHNSGYDSRI